MTAPRSVKIFQNSRFYYSGQALSYMMRLLRTTTFPIMTLSWQVHNCGRMDLRYDGTTLFRG